MLDMCTLRGLISSIRGFHDCLRIEPAGLVNNGFPGTFNISFSEPEHLATFGQYLNYDRDFIYSKIQPCFRFSDWTEVTTTSNDSKDHLALFHLADIGGAIALSDAKSGNSAVQFAINGLWRFLVESLGLDRHRITVKLFKESTLSQATNSKYPLKMIVPSDVSSAYWRQLGLQMSNLDDDSSGSTFLALRLFGKSTPWGYRNELLYEFNGRMIDIATVEHLLYAPVYADPQSKLHLWSHRFVIAAVGLERLLLVSNKLHDISDCDTVKPLKQLLMANTESKCTSLVRPICEGIRVLHKINVDAGEMQHLSRHRRQKIAKILKDILRIAKKSKTDLTRPVLERFVKLNARLNPWDNVMQTSIRNSIRELTARLN